MGKNIKETANEKKNKTGNKWLKYLLLIVCLITAGYFGYNYYQQKQMEKIDAQITEIREQLKTILDATTTVVEIKESEAKDFELESLLALDEKYTVEWDKELDRINSGSYTATVSSLTENGNLVEVKHQLSVLIEDDVKPEITISTENFGHQIKNGEKFDLESLNSIVGDVRDTKDGDLPYRKSAGSSKGYWFEVTPEDTDFSKLKAGDRIDVKIVAQDNAGNRAEQTIRVVCSSEAVDNPVAEKHEHKFGSWTTTKQPTCTAKGSKNRTCSECGYTETVSIDALGHDVKWSVTKKATCTDNGERTGKCSRCGNEVRESIKPLGHDFKLSNTNNATCTQDGLKTFKCSRCGETKTEVIKALGHDYKVVSETPATCTQAGSRTLKCSRCNETKTETISALGHNYVQQWVVDKPAWSETVHHDAVYYNKPIYKEVRYYVFQRDDGSTVRYTMEQINAMGYVNASAYFDDHLDEFWRYYTQTEYELIGYEPELVAEAYDEVIYHDEEGHWEEVCSRCGGKR